MENPTASLSEGLAAIGTARAYPRRAVVFQEGDESRQVYVVISGRLKVFLADGEGREIVLDYLNTGDVFGEMSLDGQPRSASVMTLEPSKLAIVRHDELRRFLAGNPDAAFELLTTVIRRARNLSRVAGGLALLDVYGRTARMLLEMAEPEGDRLLIRERFTQHELATRVGATREMVSRILSDMRDGGFVTPTPDGLVIHPDLPARR